ncbi:cytochrome P450 [Heliocybe sulcata]|uniref:Cytochrome P450 n=1 Tax=Heliocybe sulcata TaxID=5364 RepID=A0A5C3MJB6_9AGAM|nr:cytochrome P450 [Heliocybe sulcata]
MFFWLACVAVLVAAVAFVRRSRRNPLRLIPGPPAVSLLLGNEPQLLEKSVGEMESEWHRRYGSVVRLKSTFGDDRIMISDPKALQYMFNTAAYTFPKPDDQRAIMLQLNGRDLVWAEGETHKRQRKVMLPAFGGPEARALYPIFLSIVERLTTKWQDIIGRNQDGSYAELNVHSWLSHATLDAIGEAAFDYPFGTLDDSETPLGKAYQNFIIEANGVRDTARIVSDGIMRRMPPLLLGFLFKNLPGQRLDRIRQTKKVAYGVAEQLVKDKGQAIAEGRTNKDVMSLLVKANLAESGSRRLIEDELYAEMSLILLAGHETTSTSLTWILWELAKRPEVQTRLRDEIVAAHAQAQDALSLNDIEKMPYFQAVLKEAMRIHPAVFHMNRVAAKDTALPLFKPIRLTSGQLVDTIVVPKGTRITTSVGCYNRNPDVWGEDADEFRPERWLSDTSTSAKGASLGVVGNLFNFSSGQRSCIGWRFAMAEMQCFLAELIRNFEYSIDPQIQIKKVGDGIVIPVVVGKEEKGSLMPLRVSLVSKD